jgi:hypothetical protein
MRVSKNSGKDFGSTKNLSNNPAFSTDPVIKASGNNVYVAWLEDTSGDLDNFEVMFKRSTNKGDSFGGTKNLSNTSDDSSQVVISTSDPVVYVAWKEGSFPSNVIMLKRSTDRGSHFGSRINVSNDPIESNTPVMARDGNNLYIAWQGGDDFVLDILFKRSIDKGVSFGNVINLSNSPDKDSFDPQIASTNGNVFVTWTEFIDGDFKVFFRGTTSSQFAGSNTSHIILPLPGS